ncbi:MAG: hypothetical protein L3J87_01300, partial [Thermoplasmata archaeon]|nr:hypothetical protein [Thermoplasmata archaeon]
LNQVYVIAGTKVVATIAGGQFNSPHGIVYDPGDAVMIVANSGWDNVSFIDSFNLVIGTNTVGTTPFYLAYDPYYSRILVTNWNSNNVTSIDAVYPGLEAHNINIPVGSNPTTVAFDYANDYDYVANPNSNNVTVFLGNYAGGGTSIPVKGGPWGVVWDQAKLEIYVTANPPSHPAKIVAIQGTTIVRTIVAPNTSIAFDGMAYDDATDRVYVADNGGQVYLYP